MTSFQDSNCPFPETFEENAISPLSLLISQEMKSKSEKINIDLIRHVISLPQVKSHIFLAKFDKALVTFHLELAGWKPFKNCFIRGNMKCPEVIIFGDGRQGTVEVVLLTEGDSPMFTDIVGCYLVKPAVLEDKLSDIISYNTDDSKFLIPGKYENHELTYNLKIKYKSVNSEKFSLWRLSMYPEGLRYSATVISTGDEVIILPSLVKGAYYHICVGSIGRINGPEVALVYISMIKEKTVSISDEQIREDIQKFYTDFFVDVTYLEVRESNLDILTPFDLEKPVSDLPTTVSIPQQTPKLTFCQKLAKFFTN